MTEESASPAQPEIPQTESAPAPVTQPTAAPQETPVEAPQSKAPLIIAGIVVLVLLGLLVTGAVLLMQEDQAARTAQVRDVFIIFMALETLVIGVALVILTVQLSILINLLQHEIKPILNSTNETVNTLRGTVKFLSDNLAEPVIKLNEYIAGFKRLTDLFRPGRK